jgi:predicted transcriptional regulator of viral defense system
MAHTKGNSRMATTKTLGGDSAELLLRLSAAGKSIFSVADALTVTGKSYKAATALLGELTRRGWLVRLMRGRYVIVPLEAGLESIPMADRYVVARELLRPLPYYVSHYSAIVLHQMTTQPVNTVYVTVPRAAWAGQRQLCTSRSDVARCRALPCSLAIACQP